MDEKLVRVHGGGTGDDTPAIQAFIDGRVFGRADGEPIMPIRPGDYLAHPLTQEGQ